MNFSIVILRLCGTAEAVPLQNIEFFSFAARLKPCPFKTSNFSALRHG